MRKIANIFFIFLSFSCFFIPTTYVKAETLKDYEDLLKKYKDEQAKNNSEINKTQNALNSAKSQIESIKKELEDMALEIEKMRQEIVDYNEQIKEKSLETKELFKYLQIAQNENLYMEYAFDAETTTDLIYRISVIQQLTEYNEKIIKNLEQMIKDNENREVELNKKEEEMHIKRNDLTKRVTELTGVKASLNENSVTVKQQIQIYQEIVKSYKNLGCKSNDVIGKDCAVTNNVAGWFRPIESGYVTSEVGYRWGSFHRGLDVSNKSPYSTKIYPVANGTIKAKYYDAYGALTIVIEHKTSGGKYYSSLYTHMSKFAPNLYVGKNVTVNDYIGYMGDTGMAYGPHLHLEIAPCRLYHQSDKNCGSWNKYASYAKKLYNNGTFKGPRDLLYFPKSGVTFKGRA